MKKTIIVTGGAGFIGGNFVYHMLNKYPEYRIVCVDCLTYLKRSVRESKFPFLQDQHLRQRSNLSVI